MHSRAKRLLLLVLGIALLFGAGFAVTPLQQMRQKYDLTSEPVKGISPQLALATQVLGWGRGILIDVLWIRMESLKTQDKYFELVQLADWACKLAPRFPQVWEFQAWNLAYNVSCRVDYLLDRWAWVWSGIKLLRDEGIPQNPNAFRLYESLSWMIFHKIGEQDDNAHFFYKRRFALMMHGVLGGDGDREALQEFAEAPRSVAELLEDEQVRRLAERCDTLGFDIVGGFFELVAGVPLIPDEVRELVTRPENGGAMRKIDAYARAKRLREEFKLEPERMIQLVDEYGPFDWRSPFPHAVYWASIGLDRLDAFEKRFYGTLEEFDLDEPVAHTKGEFLSEEDEKLYEWHRVNLTRLIYNSMQSLVGHGRVLFDTQGNVIAEVGTDYRFADGTVDLFEKATGRFGSRFERGITTGYKHFLARGVIEFYFMGDPVKSLEYYNKLKDRFEDAVYGKSFDEYLEWRERDYRGPDDSALSFGDARRIVRAYAYRYWFCMGANADDKAQVLEGEAKTLADQFNQEAEDLRGMIRYKQIKESALVDILTGKIGLSPDVLENLKVRVEEERPGLVKAILARVRRADEQAPKAVEVDEDLLID